MKIEIDKQFLINQKLPRRIGCLGDIEIKKSKKRKGRKIKKLTSKNFIYFNL